MTQEVDAFLAHYGVKGMKWGVHKDRQGAERAAAERLAYEGQFGQARIDYVSREISESDYHKLSSKPIKLSDANGEFHRVSKDASGRLRGDMVYVTKDANDHNTYTALFAPEANVQNARKYSNTVKVSDIVISPSYKERIDTFIETLDQPITKLHDGTVVNGRAYVVGLDEPPYFKAMTNREIGLKYYQTVTQQQHANEPFNQAFIDNVKKKGYNAIIDDADRGMLGTLPIILFPKESGARVTEIRPITPDEVLLARANLNMPTNYLRGHEGGLEVNDNQS